MQFIDPVLFECPDCNAELQRSVADLILFNTSCDRCGASLHPVGRSMREGLSEWASFVGRADLWVHLEDCLGRRIPEAAIAEPQTVQELVDSICAPEAGISTREAEVSIAAFFVKEGLVAESSSKLDALFEPDFEAEYGAKGI